MSYAVYVCAAAALAAGAVPARAALSPVFEYNFPASSSNLTTSTTVTDVSTGAHNGTAAAFTGTGLTGNVPPGKTGQSADHTTAGNHFIKTNATSLLTSSAIASNGGFTEDVWIFPTAVPATGQVSKIIDYAGTDHLSLTETGALRWRFNDDTATNVLSSALTLNAWHHAVVRFDTTGNVLTASSIAGQFTLTVDGVSTGPVSRTKATFGDSLNRSIGVGAHPNGGEYFAGYIYDPIVSLGVAPVPEPAAGGLLAVGGLGLLARRRRRPSAP